MTKRPARPSERFVPMSESPQSVEPHVASTASKVIAPGAGIDALQASVADSIVVETLLRSAHLVRGQLSTLFSEYGLSEIRYLVLQSIAAAQPAGATQKQLSKQFCQAESSISTLVQRMCHDGLLIQKPSPADGRRRILDVTETGLRLMNTASVGYEAWVRRLFSSFSADEVSILNQTLGRIAQTLSV